MLLNWVLLFLFGAMVWYGTYAKYSNFRRLKCSRENQFFSQKYHLQNARYRR